MSLKVSRAREQVGQWMVAAVAVAFVASMGLMAYAKYIDDKYASVPGNQPRVAQRAAPAPTEPEAGVEAVSHTSGEAQPSANTDAARAKPAKQAGHGVAIGLDSN